MSILSNLVVIFVPLYLVFKLILLIIFFDASSGSYWAYLAIWICELAISVQAVSYAINAKRALRYQRPHPRLMEQDGNE